MAKPWPDDDRHRIEACEEKIHADFQILKLNSKKFLLLSSRLGSAAPWPEFGFISLKG
jgi:hypothetical protein